MLMINNPIVVATTNHKTNRAQTINLSVRYYYRNHKRTQQGVSAELLSYLYKLQMVYANT